MNLHLHHTKTAGCTCDIISNMSVIDTITANFISICKLCYSCACFKIDCQQPDIQQMTNTFREDGV